MQDLSDFCSRAIFNAKKCGDVQIMKKMQRLLTPVIDGTQIIRKDVDELDAYNWSIDRLSAAENSGRNISGDALDQLILCAKSLKYDATEIANFLAYNSTVLFSTENENKNSVKSRPTSSYSVASTVSQRL